eukprot:1887261-Rhodomonas_salina.2
MRWSGETQVEFKVVGGRIELKDPEDPYNHSKNRAEHIRDLDPNIEMGYPTEFDRFASASRS